MIKNQLLSLMAAVIVIKIIYFLGKAFFAFLFGVHDDHLFIGKGKKIFSLTILGAKVSVGIFVPLPFVENFYSIIEGKKYPLGWPWEFFDKPWWQRLIASYGGVYALLLAGVFVFVILTFMQSERFISKEEVNKWGIYPSEIGRSLGFEEGDRIAKVNGKDYQKFSELTIPDFPKSGDKIAYEVNRSGRVLEVVVPQKYLEYGYRSQVFQINEPFHVGEVSEKMSLDENGLRNGDRILKIDTLEITGYPHWKELIARYALDSVKIHFMRNDQVLNSKF